MISKLRGSIREIAGTKVQVEIGPFWYEVHVPAMVVDRLPPLGVAVTLHVVSYIEGGAMRTISKQKLLGFLEPVEREFFELFTSVKDIGIRKALKAFSQPVSAIAGAIEREDIRALQRLPGIGPKASRQIVAELTGKAAKYALLREQSYADAATTAEAALAAAGKTSPSTPPDTSTTPDIPEAVPQGLAGVIRGRLPEHVADVRHVLTSQLHYKPAEADDLIARSLTDDAALAKDGPDAAEKLMAAIFQRVGPKR